MSLYHPPGVPLLDSALDVPALRGLLAITDKFRPLLSRRVPRPLKWLLANVLTFAVLAVMVIIVVRLHSKGTNPRAAWAFRPAKRYMPGNVAHHAIPTLKKTVSQAQDRGRRGKWRGGRSYLDGLGYSARDSSHTLAERVAMTAPNDQADTSQMAMLSDARRAALHLGTDPDPAVRAEAALTLDQVGDPAHLGALLVALNDPHWFVRSNVGWALVHLGNVARPHVEVIAKTTLNDDAREMARLVLERLA